MAISNKSKRESSARLEQPPGYLGDAQEEIEQEAPKSLEEEIDMFHQEMEKHKDEGSGGTGLAEIAGRTEASKSRNRNITYNIGSHWYSWSHKRLSCL